MATFVIVVDPETLSVAISANSNSFEAVVDTVLAIVVAFVERAVETFASTVIPTGAGPVDTARFTALPEATDAPAAGFSVMT